MPVNGFDEGKNKVEVHTKEEVDNIVTDIEQDVMDAITPTITQMQSDIDDMESDISTFETNVNSAVSGKENKHLTRTAILFGGSTYWTQVANNVFTQNVAVNGVTAGNTVVVSPAPDSSPDTAFDYLRDFGSYEICCYVQGINTLGFRASQMPEADIPINVMILGG